MTGACVVTFTVAAVVVGFVVCWVVVVVGAVLCHREYGGFYSQIKCTKKTIHTHVATI